MTSISFTVIPPATLVSLIIFHIKKRKSRKDFPWRTPSKSKHFCTGFQFGCLLLCRFWQRPKSGLFPWLSRLCHRKTRLCCSPWSALSCSTTNGIQLFAQLWLLCGKHAQNTVLFAWIWISVHPRRLSAAPNQNNLFLNFLKISFFFYQQFLDFSDFRDFLDTQNYLLLFIKITTISLSSFSNLLNV